MNPGSFDWITPAFSMIGRARGVVVGERIPVEYYWEVKESLGKIGVRMHNGFDYGDQYVFDVKASQKDAAEGVIDRILGQKFGSC